MIGFEQTLIRHTEQKTRWRPLVPTLFPIALLTAIAPIGCGPDDACAATATCPPSAQIDATTDAHRDGGTFVGTDGNGHAGDAGSEADRAPALDATVSPDVTRDAPIADAPLADQARSDGSFEDARGQDVTTPDVGSDAPVETDGGASDGAVGTDAGPVDAPLDSAPCDIDAARSPYDNLCLIHERFGVFVSPAGSDATGAGTRAAPYRTVNRALQAAKVDTRRVYACDNGTGYVDGVTLDATLDGMELFGGFNCATWMLNGVGRTQINATSGPALTAKGLVVGVTFERFDFASTNAETGASSIAILLDTAANVVLRKARIVAGRGGAGRAGAPGDPGADGNVAGPEQDGAPAEYNAPPMDRLGGAWAQASVCGSRGGTGLPSSALTDQQAESGVPITGVTPPNQVNGGGGFLGTPAGPGLPGNPGNSGTRASLTGVFSASGFAPAPAASGGTDGRTGQGGGGGVRGVELWGGANVATGGAGGMGGCGGKGGLGGGGGGASVGLLVWSSSVSLDQCEIVASAGGAGGNGGNGGKGGLGMPGGRGGAASTTDGGGTLATAGENGGKGGNGGDGGSGAGGNGGPSYALVYKGTRPTAINTTLSPGAPGASGVGGYAGGLNAPDGATGTSGPELSL